MAKLRVYELARELNMENKALLGKMEEMGITVKSHMSSLDEAAIKQIKEMLFGTKAPEEVVEDKRIKPNVIRRRRKRVPPPVEPEVAETPEVSAKEEEVKEAKESAPPEKEAEDEVVETPEEAVAPELPEAEQTVETDEPVPDTEAMEQEQDVPAEKPEEKAVAEETAEVGVKTETEATEIPAEPEEEKPVAEETTEPEKEITEEKPASI